MNPWQSNRRSITLTILCCAMLLTTLLTTLPTTVHAQSPPQNKREAALEETFQDLRSAKFGVRQRATQRLVAQGKEVLIQLESKVLDQELDFQNHCLQIIALIGRNEDTCEQAINVLERLSANSEFASSGKAAQQLLRLKESNVDRAIKRLTSSGVKVQRMGINGPVHYVSGISRDEQCKQLRYFTKLSNVTISGRGITNKCIPMLAKSPSIQSLSIAQTSISPTGLAELSTLSSLNRLYLSGSFSSAGLTGLKRLKNLKWLTIATAIGDEELESIVQLPVQQLQLMSLQISPKVPQLLEALKAPSLTLHLRNLEDTDLTWAQNCKATSIVLIINGSPKLSDAGVQGLKNSNVIQLNIAQTGITKNAMKTFGAMPKLQVLTISDAAIDDASLMDLIGLKNLRNLSLTKTKVTAKGLEKIKQSMENLRYTRISPTPKAAPPKPVLPKPAPPKPVPPKPVPPKPAPPKAPS